MSRLWERALPLLALTGCACMAAAMADAAPFDASTAPTESAAAGHDLQAMADRLHAKLASGSADARDAASWALLARSPVALRAFGAADGAYAQALRLSPLQAQWPGPVNAITR